MVFKFTIFMIAFSVNLALDPSDILCDILVTTTGGKGALMSSWNCNENIAAEAVCNGNSSSWMGVVCTFGRVTELSLAGIKIAGNLPYNLGFLDSLQKLDFSSNFLTGTVPPSYGHLKNLNELVLAQNHLTGYLPSQLCNLKLLSKVNIQANTGLICHPECFNIIGRFSKDVSLNDCTTYFSYYKPSISETGNLNKLDQIKSTSFRVLRISDNNITATSQPSTEPTMFPTSSPSTTPTLTPTLVTEIPTNSPSSAPTITASPVVTTLPVSSPTLSPTRSSSVPTNTPTQRPSTPTNIPTLSPSMPTNVPSPFPVRVVTRTPTIAVINYIKKDSKIQLREVLVLAVVFVMFVLVAIIVCLYCYNRPPTEEIRVEEE